MGKPLPSRHPEPNVRAFRTALAKWFTTHGKDYPWRRTQDPWAVLVSEIMLQQTTVASVIANRRFELFLDEFPDLQSIAKAPEQKILKAWEGLGYYNRVRNLQKTAQELIKQYDGKFPADAKTLETLPGVGRYTAGAVSSFAFEQAAPIVDGNIARVISRLFDSALAIDSTAGQKFLWEKAARLLDPKSPRLFNSALMELGQTQCSPKSAACESCPVRDFCQCSSPDSLPVKKPRRQFVPVDEHAFLHLKGNKILLAHGNATRRKGFWHLPLREPEVCAHLEPVSTHRYTITHHRVTVHLYRNDPGNLLEGESFQALGDLPDLPIASPIRKILNQEL